MAFYTEGNDEWMRQQRLAQRRSYFPNTGAGNQQPRLNPGVAEGLARIKQLQSQPRPELTTYTLPSGGTVRIPALRNLPSGYAQAQNQPVGTLTGPTYSDVPSGVQPSQQVTPAQTNLIQQQGRAQGYYGTQPSDFPLPTRTGTSQYAGGPYTTQGGVVNPAPSFPNIFQRFGAAERTAENALYNLPATQSAVRFGQNMLSSLYTNLFGSRTTAPTQPSYAYRPPFNRNQPRSYFDDQNYGY